MLIGFLNFLIGVMFILPLAGYLSGTEIDGFNIILENHKILEKVFEDSLKSHPWTVDSSAEIMHYLRIWFFTIVVIFTSYAGVSSLFSFLVVIGVWCEVRSLIVPFLILSMVNIVLAGAVGIVIVVALFYLNTVLGVVSIVVYLTVAIVSIYFWAVLLSAFNLIGNEMGYDYSIIRFSKKNPSSEYYPSAPQHFVMDDYRDLQPLKHQ